MHPMRSDLIGPEFWPEYCRRVFGDKYVDARVNQTNTDFGGLDLIKGSNFTIFLNGGEDPWQWATMYEFPDPALAAERNLVKDIIQCVDCGHCVDLKLPSHKDPIELLKARNYIEGNITQWLNIQDMPAPDVYFLQG